MKSKNQWLCVAFVAVCAKAGLAQDPADDPLHGLLFPPEVLIHHRDEVGLTDRQAKQIQAHIEEAGPAAQHHQTQISKAMGRLAELLSAETVDQEAALKQLDEVLAIEKAQKRLHLRLMIRIRNELTGEQRQVAAKIQRTSKSTEGLEQRLKAKLARIEKEVQTRAIAGQPPFEVVGLMQKFPELMKNSQVEEAEALLDRVLKMLGLEEGDSKSNNETSSR